jgi:hypothetical protein
MESISINYNSKQTQNQNKQEMDGRDLNKSDVSQLMEHFLDLFFVSRNEKIILFEIPSFYNFVRLLIKYKFLP